MHKRKLHTKISENGATDPKLLASLNRATTIEATPPLCPVHDATLHRCCFMELYHKVAERTANKTTMTAADFVTAAPTSCYYSQVRFDSVMILDLIKLLEIFICS